jgi:hypothetical protein
MNREASKQNDDRAKKNYPHKVVGLAASVSDSTVERVIQFHKESGVPLKCVSTIKNDCTYSIYCFADKTHAEIFRLTFGGEFV